MLFPDKLRKILGRVIKFLLNFKLLLILALLSIIADYISKQKVSLLIKNISDYVCDIFGIYACFGFSVVLFKKLKKVKKYRSFCSCIFIDLIILGLVFLLPKIIDNLIISNILGTIFLTAAFLALYFLIFLTVKPILWIKNIFLSLVKSNLFKKFSKLLAKLLLIILIFFFLFIIIFNQNIPAFIYNEMEWYQRGDYYFAEQTKGYYNELISIRKGQSHYILNDNEMYKLPQNLKDVLKEREFFINDYERINNQQTKIPFLSKKYKEYHKLKTEAFENYKKGFETFKTAFDDQDKILKLSNRTDDLNQMLVNGIKKSIIPNPNLVLAKNLLEETNQLYKDGVIDADAKTLFDFRNQQLIDVYDFLLNLKGKNPTKEETNKLMVILSRKPGVPDFNTIFQNMNKNIFEPRRKQMDDYHKLAFDQMMIADKYYQDNNLQNDLISLILSKFSKKYPKNI